MDDTVTIYGFGDAAQRISDTIRTAIVNGDRGRWIAFSLEDGRCSGPRDRPDTYPTKAEAIRAQGNSERNFGYIKIPWDDVTPRAAQVMLKIHRQLRDAGLMLTDPEVANHDFPLSNRREDYPDDRRHILTHTRLRTQLRSRGGLILP